MPLVIALLLNLSLGLSSALAANFTNVTYHRCYDGDTCTFTLPGVHPLFGEKISVRIGGIDTPEIRGKCEQEKTLAKEARDVVRGILEKAHRINLLDAERGKYFRIVANVVADSKDIGRILLDQGLAVEYDGGTKSYDWCLSDTFDTPSSETFSCIRSKKRCTDMASCEEAYFYLRECGMRSFDRDKDGIPCESLCQ